MRFRLIQLVLAIGSLILISFMLPLALLLRTFTAENAVNGATIRAQFVASTTWPPGSANCSRTSERR